MTNRRCAVCERAGRLNDATVLDSSGAVLARICNACRLKIESERCRVCGSRDAPQRAEGVFFNDDGGPVYRICDGCRNDLLAEDREVSLA